MTTETTDEFDEQPLDGELPPQEMERLSEADEAALDDDLEDGDLDDEAITDEAIDTYETVPASGPDEATRRAGRTLLQGSVAGLGVGGAAVAIDGAQDLKMVAVVALQSVATALVAFLHNRI